MDPLQQFMAFALGRGATAPAPVTDGLSDEERAAQRRLKGIPGGGFMLTPGGGSVIDDFGKLKGPTLNIFTDGKSEQQRQLDEWLGRTGGGGFTISPRQPGPQGTFEDGLTEEERAARNGPATMALTPVERAVLAEYNRSAEINRLLRVGKYSPDKVSNDIIRTLRATVSDDEWERIATEGQRDRRAAYEAWEAAKPTWAQYHIEMPDISLLRSDPAAYAAAFKAFDTQETNPEWTKALDRWERAEPALATELTDADVALRQMVPHLRTAFGNAEGEERWQPDVSRLPLKGIFAGMQDWPRGGAELFRGMAGHNLEGEASRLWLPGDIDDTNKGVLSAAEEVEQAKYFGNRYGNNIRKLLYSLVAPSGEYNEAISMGGAIGDWNETEVVNPLDTRLLVGSVGRDVAGTHHAPFEQYRAFLAPPKLWADHEPTLREASRQLKQANKLVEDPQYDPFYMAQQQAWLKEAPRLDTPDAAPAPAGWSARRMNLGMGERPVLLSPEGKRYLPRNVGNSNDLAEMEGWLEDDAAWAEEDMRLQRIEYFTGIPYARLYDEPETARWGQDYVDRVERWYAAKPRHPGVSDPASRSDLMDDQQGDADDVLRSFDILKNIYFPRG